MVAELTAVQYIVQSLTHLDGLPVVIVQCVVTTIYTCECACGTYVYLSVALTPASPRWIQSVVRDGYVPRRNGDWRLNHRRYRRRNPSGR